MSAGRPATPLALKLLANNPGKENLDKLQEESPQYDPISVNDDITPPDYLNELGKQTYIDIARKMAGRNVLTQMDDFALELLIESYQEFREHQEYLECNGYTYEVEDKEGNVKTVAYPQAALKSDAHKRVVALLTQFGWTPSSRTKVKIVKEQKDPIAHMKRGGNK